MFVSSNVVRNRGSAWFCGSMMVCISADNSGALSLVPRLDAPLVRVEQVAREMAARA